jgi:class 3 adenylate cyclase
MAPMSIPTAKVSRPPAPRAPLERRAIARTAARRSQPARGFADRSGYTAIGTVCNLALCAEAKDGQILVAQRVAVAVEATMPLEEVGELTLKGLTQPVVAFNVPLAATQPLSV